MRALLVVLLLPGALLAQTTGQRVRVVTSEGTVVTGRVGVADTARIAVDATGRGTVVHIPRGSITAMHISDGPDRSRGALLGTLVGIALGAWVAADLARESGSDFTEPDGTLTVVAISVPVALTIGLGTLAGYALAPEKWHPVRLPPATGVGHISVDFGPTDEVRVTARGQRREGFVGARSENSLSLISEGAVQAIPLSEVTRISVLGDKSRKRGAVRGAIIITGITAIGIATDPLPTVAQNVGVAVSNAAFGALIGAFFPMKRWTDLPVPRAR